MKVGIIILNWNGWQDTLECLESIKSSKNSKYTCVVIDNNSEHESINKIKRWINTRDGFYKREITTNPLEEINTARRNSNNSFLLYLNDENSGFARGNNLAIRWLLDAGFERIFLLNNDTIIYPDTLARLTEYSKIQDYDVITSNIVYHYDNSLIWNSGGKFTITGTRKYYYQHKKLQEHNQGIKKIEFATGCALMVKSSVFTEIGLLTEKFFFGEEDFDFCKRLKKYKKGLYCAMDTVLEHKVGNSKKELIGSEIQQAAAIHLINRFVSMKQYYSKPIWHIWQLLTIGYIFIKFSLIKRTNLRKNIKFSRTIYKYSMDLDSVQLNTINEVKQLLS